MKHNKLFAAMMALTMTLSMLSGCGNTTGTTNAAADTGSAYSEVATAEEMTTHEEVVEEGMVPITGDKIKDGTYPIAVASNSTMFNITDCTLTVKDGEMTARRQLAGMLRRRAVLGT